MKTDPYLMIVGRVESIELHDWTLTGRDDGGVFTEAMHKITDERIMVPIAAVFEWWRTSRLVDDPSTLYDEGWRAD